MNYSKIKDAIVPSSSSEVKIGGKFSKAMEKVTENLFLKLDPEELVRWFKERSDPFAAGEFFGKILRAAVNICASSKDQRLKAFVDRLVRNILQTRDPDGCISTVRRRDQPNGYNGSDLWERKYVLLGLYEYYRNFGPSVDKDNDVLDAMISLAEYTAGQIGDEKGKTPITDTGWAFCGMESSSILEPFMKLYLISGKKELLDFGSYIVRSGACSRENIFEAAHIGKSPYKFGSVSDPKQSIAKAYEMMSCFEGLLEYYRATGEPYHLEAAINFIGKIIDEEITYLGSGGADGPYNLGPGKGEQWNRTKFEQTNPSIDLAMETCVTVTYMKLLYKAYLITGDVSLVDRIEVSLYNALLGALNETGDYFEYFPKFNGTRRVFDNFSYKVGGMDLSCCTANGPMGFALIPELAVTKKSCGSEHLINLFLPFSYDDRRGTSFSLETDYPRTGKVKLKVVSAPPGGLNIGFRMPGFITSATLTKHYKAVNGYAKITEKLFTGDEVTFLFEYSPLAHSSPVSINPLAEDSVLYTYGPLVLALDKSIVNEKFDGIYGEEIKSYETGPLECDGSEDLFKVKINGNDFIPYYAAGRSFDERTEFKCWLKRK